MNRLVFHIVSGESFVTGIVLILGATIASLKPGRIRSRAVRLALVIGLVAVVASSTPIPAWQAVIVAATTVAWQMSWFFPQWRRNTASAMLAVWGATAFLELPFQPLPTLVPAPDRVLGVIGDSVTSGMGGEDRAETWPAILAREHNLTVIDQSHVGETAASARKRLEQRPIDAPVILVEIGGNDLLGATTSAQFARDLDALLTDICQNGRQVVMFELPLPPLCHRYGAVQRTVARRHGVLLVPKRAFLSVLARDQSTLDSIHLSQAGHRRMAELVWQLVESAYQCGQGASRSD